MGSIKISSAQKEYDQILGELYEEILVINKQNKYLILVIFGPSSFMRCTLREDLLPESFSIIKESVDDFNAQNAKDIAAWDIHFKRWRSFDVDSVRYAQDVSENY